MLVLGGAALDWVARVETLPGRDGIVQAASFRAYPGGSAANVAVGLARLGLRAAFAGKLADDEPGRLLRAAFAEAGVDCRALQVVSDRPSAACFIAVDRAGDRLIVGLPGVSLLERTDELDLELARRCRTLYIGPAYPQVAGAAAAAAHAAGAPVFWNPAGLADPASLAPFTGVLGLDDCLVASRAEVVGLAGGGEPEPAARRLASLVGATVVETLGDQGAFIATPGGEGWRVPAALVAEVVDTTGAGDAFAAGLVAGALDGMPWPEAAALGCAAAGLKVQHEGARQGLPTRAEAAAALAAWPGPHARRA